MPFTGSEGEGAGGVLGPFASLLGTHTCVLVHVCPSGGGGDWEGVILGQAMQIMFKALLLPSCGELRPW